MQGAPRGANEQLKQGADVPCGQRQDGHVTAFPMKIALLAADEAGANRAINFLWGPRPALPARAGGYAQPRAFIAS